MCGKWIGTISRSEYSESDIRTVAEKVDFHELYVGREVGRSGFAHYQFCIDCAGDLETLNADLCLGWHIERAVDWEKSKNYCRKSGNYLYIGDSREERYYNWITRKPAKDIWRTFGCSVVSQNDRCITCWVDTQGSATKSTFCYILERRGKCLSVPRTEQSATRIIDFVTAHYNNEPLIIVDLPRDKKVTADLCKALETIKDGTLTSAKYHGQKIFAKGVKILLFTNHYIPKQTYTALSRDRWDVRSVKKYEESQGNTDSSIHSIEGEEERERVVDGSEVERSPLG